MTNPTAAEPAAPVTGESMPMREADLVSRVAVFRICWELGDKIADLALYGLPENARSREAMEAACTRIRCAVALMPSAMVPSAPADIVALVDAYGVAVHTTVLNRDIDGIKPARDTLLADLGRMGRGTALEDWRPIKSAACVEGAVLLGWGQYREMDGEQPAFMRWYDGVHPGWYVSGMEFFPTHWQPLPSAPGAAPPPPPAGEPVEPSPDAHSASLYEGHGNWQNHVVHDWIWRAFENGTLCPTNGSDPLMVRTGQDQWTHLRPGEWLARQSDGTLSVRQPTPTEPSSDTLREALYLIAKVGPSSAGFAKPMKFEPWAKQLAEAALASAGELLGAATDPRTVAQGGSAACR